jgi:hypothetical protein
MKREDEPMVDEFDLELQLAGAELDADRRAALDGAAHLEPARDEIARLERWWADQRPPLPSAPSRTVPRAPRWPWLTGLAAVVAMLLFVVLFGLEQDPGFQARGVVAVDVLRVRDGAPVDAGEPFLAGDQLAVAMVPDASRRIHVATLQRDGAVSHLVDGQPVDAGHRFQLPGRVALDDYGGREWLVVLATPERLSPSVAEARIRSLLPDPEAQAGDGLWVIEVTRHTGAPR